MNRVKLQYIKKKHTEIPCILYIHNEKIEREIKETIPFTIATKRIKYVGIYLPKKTKELCISSVQLLSRVQLFVTP